MQPLWKTGGPQKTKNRTIICPSNSTPGYIFEDNKSADSKRYTHPNFIAPLFTTATYMSSTDERRCAVCICILLIHKKIMKILPFAKKWIDLEDIILSKVNYTEKHKYWRPSLIHKSTIITQTNEYNKKRHREQISGYQ